MDACCHGSPYGMIEASWEIVNLTFRLGLLIPHNCTAEAVLPGDNEPCVVGSGSHEFTCDFEQSEWPPMPTYPPFSQTVNDDEP